ncbi:MAG TPA: hypothetical protein VFL95_04105, partial [Gemmatimonadales bacterium]|nr:hypothetical protein [Gemmatimonadales bacterium]
QEARVSKTSVAGSWGAVAGSLRYFADRFGIPRASIEGTTLPYDLVREHAQWGAAKVYVAGNRRDQGLVEERARTYFGFQLEAQVEPIRGRIPDGLVVAARDALTDALLEGQTIHPDQGRLRRAVGELDEIWRRSGGTVPAADPARVRAEIRSQLDDVRSWDEFLRTRIALDPTEVPEEIRDRMRALPASVHLAGDAVPIEYEIEAGMPVARIWLREGQARRLQRGELPELDRPLRFGARRNRGDEPVLAETLPELLSALKRAPKRPRRTEAEAMLARKGRQGRSRHGRGGPRGRGRGGRGPGRRH